MKIKGKKITPPKPVIIPIPRDDGEDLFFTCAAVLDFSEFDTVCPAPKPPVWMRPNKPNQVDTQDKKYLRNLDIYAQRKTAWLILKSLQATEDLEWETVDMQDPTTWDNFREEMEESLTPREVDLVIQGVFDANLPSEDRQNEALERFTLSQVEGDDNHSSQKEEQDSIPSGGLASD